VKQGEANLCVREEGRRKRALLLGSQEKKKSSTFPTRPRGGGGNRTRKGKRTQDLRKRGKKLLLLNHQEGRGFPLGRKLPSDVKKKRGGENGVSLTHRAERGQNSNTGKGRRGCAPLGEGHVHHRKAGRDPGPRGGEKIYRARKGKKGGQQAVFKGNLSDGTTEWRGGKGGEGGPCLVGVKKGEGKVFATRGKKVSSQQWASLRKGKKKEGATFTFAEGEGGGRS